MIDDDNWWESNSRTAGVEILDAMEKRLAEEFKYLVGEAKTDFEAYPVTARNQKARSH